MTTQISIDPLFPDQWYLLNTGQSGGTPGVDINVVGAWEESFTGKGVTVVDNDTGLDYTNPDIAPNFDAATSGSVDTTVPSGGEYADYYPYNSVFSSSDTVDIATLAHGTSTAGLIAGANNGSGLMGVAYESTISAYRLLDTPEDDSSRTFWTATEDAFLNELDENFDVANNSWGFSDPLEDSVYSSGAEGALGDLLDAAAEGRGGLGIINVFAAGNGGTADDTNLHAFQSSINVITVAAIDDTGTIGVHDSTYSTSRFSTPGASILVSAPGVDMAVDDIVGSAGWSSLVGDTASGFNITATADGDQVFGLDGTSFAAPLVTGVVALMLEANPKLGLRDVQEILAYTATETDPSDPTWLVNTATNWNGGGMHVSRDYGFGLVDATAAVALAETWPLQQTVSTSTVGTPAILDTLTYAPSNGSFSSGTAFTFSVPSSDDLSLNWVRLELEVDYPAFSNFQVAITSPSGTTSVLLDGPDPDDELGEVTASGTPLQLTSDQFWGETSLGTWTVSIGGVTAAAGSGDLVQAVLVLDGSALTTTPLYVYTDEYASEVAAQPSRSELSAPGDTITLDVAAISGSNTLDLSPGGVSTVDGAPLTLGASTGVGTAIGGFGDDTFIAGTTPQALVGGGGEDTVALAGPMGSYTITNSGGNDGTVAGDGQDVTLTGIHWLQFSNVLAPLDAAAAATDFYGAGTSGILWQNSATGQVALWDMEDGSAQSTTTFGTAPAGWQAVATGDFYASGDSSILWQNSGNDSVALWDMSGASPLAQTTFASYPSGWDIVGAGDFFGTGASDILWQNPATTQVAIWEMNGASVVATGIIGTAPSGWQVGGVADFTGTGDADILWQNTVTGQVAVWDMNGFMPVSYTTIGTAPSGWTIAGVGDFGFSGADILWQNPNAGEVALWQTNGTSVNYGTIVANVPFASGWQVAGIGDYYGTGTDDILWQNTETAQIAIWQMNGSSLASASVISNIPSNWQPVHDPVIAAA